MVSYLIKLLDGKDKVTDYLVRILLEVQVIHLVVLQVILYYLGHEGREVGHAGLLTYLHVPYLLERGCLSNQLIGKQLNHSYYGNLLLAFILFGVREPQVLLSPFVVNNDSILLT